MFIPVTHALTGLTIRVSLNQLLYYSPIPPTRTTAPATAKTILFFDLDVPLYVIEAPEDIDVLVSGGQVEHPMPAIPVMDEESPGRQDARHGIPIEGTGPTIEPIDPIDAVSYTHLTLPTSDLV